MSGSHALSWIEAELERLDALHLRRVLGVRDGPQEPAHIVWNGRRLANFGSNDYLGLAGRALVPTVQRALESAGWGAGASPLVTGRGALHAQLEVALACFERTEAALLFTSGYAANMGTIPALVGKHDAIFSDAKNHASLVDGCRLSRASVHIYRHADMDDLCQRMAGARPAGRKLIVTDTLFSMDGDVAPLADLAQIARDASAMLMVDEAHATGVFGAEGRGVCEWLGVEEGAHVRVGTLSKALGSIGGFVAGSRPLIDWLTNRARPYVFSTALPEAAAAASLAALEVVRAEPWRRQSLLDLAAQLRAALSDQGWSLSASPSQIVPVVVGEPGRAVDVSAALREAGLLVPAIRPPTVPEGESLLRISLSAGHSPEALERLIEVLRELAPRMSR